MEITFTLNSKIIKLDLEPEQRLITVLREQLGTRSVLCDCQKGICGKCSVLFNNELVPACLIPIFKVQGQRIRTLEGVTATQEYNDIQQAFQMVGLVYCDFCMSGKILGVLELLSRNAKPSAHDITTMLGSFICRCTDLESFTKAVTLVSELREKRLEG